MKKNFKSLFVLVFVSVALVSCSRATVKEKNPNPLSLWNDSAPAKKALTEYMNVVTNEKSADFIPVKDRIAVFDLDGTLFCETDPIYFDWVLYTQRVLDDENYKNQATEEQIALANDLRENTKSPARP